MSLENQNPREFKCAQNFIFTISHMPTFFLCPSSQLVTGYIFLLLRIIYTRQQTNEKNVKELRLPESAIVCKIAEELLGAAKEIRAACAEADPEIGDEVNEEHCGIALPVVSSELGETMNDLVEASLANVESRDGIKMNPNLFLGALLSQRDWKWGSRTIVRHGEREKEGNERKNEKIKGG